MSEVMPVSGNPISPQHTQKEPQKHRLHQQPALATSILASEAVAHAMCLLDR